MYAGAQRKKKIEDDKIENENNAMDIDNTDDNMDGAMAEPENVTVKEQVRIMNSS